MKKIVVILMTVFLLTGCTVVRIDTKSIDNTISVVLSKNNTLYNRVGKGYKYYVPRGVTYIDTIEFNDKLYSNGNYYYLYIDVVSYYYNKKIDYKEKPNLYYSKKFNSNDRDGYLEIEKQNNNKYLIKFFYNYALIQTIVNEEDINDVILNASYILSTVKLNNNVIKIMLNEGYFKNKEEKYTKFSSIQKNDNFLEYKDDK